jgi:hypothetical protein
MRFTEIIGPEDQLALWRLISDKVWATLGQLPHQTTAPKHQPLIAPVAAKPTHQASTKEVSRVTTKTAGKHKVAPAKGHKPKRATMPPAPKPLPKPQQLHPTPTQTKQAQTQKNHQLAQQIHQALNKKAPAPTQPQPIQPKPPVATTVAHMNNSYSERDKDDLVFHRRANPFKPLSDHKPLY